MRTFVIAPRELDYRRLGCRERADLHDPGDSGALNAEMEVYERLLLKRKEHLRRREELPWKLKLELLSARWLLSSLLAETSECTENLPVSATASDSITASLANESILLAYYLSSEGVFGFCLKERQR